jgi:splicing factor 3B subunit 1
VPPFFSSFWIRRNAVDTKNSPQLVETSVEIAGKVGGAEILKRIVEDMKDENENFRKIVLQTIEKILAKYGVADIDSKLEQQLIDGILFAFQEQAVEEALVVLSAFGTIANCLGLRVKAYIPRICGTI